jgi:hypothetical protein
MIELFSIQNIIYLITSLAILLFIFLIWNIRLEIRMRRLLKGKNAKTLEDSFISMQKDLKGLEDFREEMKKYLRNVEARLSRSIRGVSNINFNAFSGLESGGKSFATAFLNEKGDGVILSSLHARDRVSIFAKEVKSYKTEVELSEEETSALTKAKESCSL